MLSLCRRAFRYWGSAMSARTALFLLIATGVCAQTGGEITGTITDQTGASLVGATITVTNINTSAARSLTSNESGVYDVPALPPGNYSIRVQATGFQNVERKDVVIQVAQI